MAVYLTASFIPMLLSLLINPLVAKNMSPNDYAIVGYYKSFSTLLLPFIQFYVLHYYTKSYYELQKEQRRVLKATIFKFLIYGSGAISVICLFGLIGYTVCFNDNTLIPLAPYIYLSIFSLPLTGVYQLTLLELKMSRQSGVFFCYSIAYSLLTFFLTWLLIVKLQQGAFGSMMSIFAANAVIFIYCCYNYRDLFRIPFNYAYLKIILFFCAPLTLAAMLSFFSGGYERVYLERLGNIDELGYYIVGATMAGYIQVFSNALGSTFQPDIFKAIVNRDRRQYLKYCAVMLGATIFIVAGVVAFAPFIMDILTAGRYVYSAKYMQLIALSCVSSSIYYMVSQFTIAIGLPKITFYNKILGSILSILMYKILIDKWHFYGAAIGVIVSFIIFALGNIALLYTFKKKLIKLWNRS